MKSETERLWAARVAAWRASGLSSEAFCHGREFTAGGLRHWAYRLRRKKDVRRAEVVSATGRNAAVRFARVAVARHRNTGPSSPAVVVAPPQASPSGVVLEVGRVRIALEAGFDRAVLSAVLELVEGGGRR